MESLSDFLQREPDYDEIGAMRERNAVKAWDGSPHPHGMMIESGQGPYLKGKIKRDGEVIDVENVVDAHGQILCNAAGYANPEIEAARALARGTGIDALSGNFNSAILEWAREALLQSLGDWRSRYKLLFVASGTEGNDMARRSAYSLGGGFAHIVNLLKGYSGSGFAASAACGNPGWRGRSTPNIPGFHLVDATREALEQTLMYAIPKGQSVSAMFEAGRFGVGGFHDIPDDFLRAMAEEVRKRKGGAYPDEVQTGVGRNGRALWNSQVVFDGMEPPEGIVFAKSIGGAHRGAGLFLRDDVAAQADGLTYHTFGSNLEDVAAMGTVINMAQRDHWTENAAARGAQLKKGFEETVKPKAAFDFSTHGESGLMFAAALDTPARVNAVLRRAPVDGWVCGKGGVDGRVLRIAPPINVSQAVIRELIEKVAVTFASDEVAKAA